MIKENYSKTLFVGCNIDNIDCSFVREILPLDFSLNQSNGKAEAVIKGQTNYFGLQSTYLVDCCLIALTSFNLLIYQLCMHLELCRCVLLH